MDSVGSMSMFAYLTHFGGSGGVEDIVAVALVKVVRSGGRPQFFGGCDGVGDAGVDAGGDAGVDAGVVGVSETAGSARSRGSLFPTSIISHGSWWSRLLNFRSRFVIGLNFRSSLGD